MVRTLVKERPRNVANLARKAVSRLVKSAGSKGNMIAMEQQSVLNISAMLARLLPILFEGERDHHFIDKVFWRGAMPAAAGSDTAGVSAVPEVVPAPSEADGPNQPLAAPMMDAILALLFKQGFTCSGGGDELTWEGGMGKSASTGKGAQFDVGRSEMLKLLLVTCSETLYVTPGIVSPLLAQMIV